MNDKIPDKSNGDILIVDDSKSDLKMLTQIVTEAGYKVRPATSGELALKSIGVKLPDLILLDIKMPGMDGIEVCNRLKSDSRAKKIPIIFLSAYGESELKVKALESGGNDYVTKPFEAAEIVARIKIHCELYKLQQKLLARTKSLKREIKKRKKVDKSLKEALTKVLSGFIPICASCKKIRDDEDSWDTVEKYVENHSEAVFSHGLCPDCMKTIYPEIYEKEN